jgi:hypothetical protein
MTILKLVHASGAVASGLAFTALKDFSAKANLDFRGVTYDMDQNILWTLENNNARLYAYDGDSGSLIKTWNILKPNRFASGSLANIQISGVNYPFISHDLPVVDFAGMVYFKDFLYVLDRTSASIYRINAFDHFTMDVEYNTAGGRVYPAFPFPSGTSAYAVWDVTMDRDENMLVATGSGAVKWELKYDYYIPDYRTGQIFYRELYDSVTTKLPGPTQASTRGDS